MKNLIEFETNFWNKKELCAGIDEVGRGCIVGPMVMALVIFPIGYFNDEINDSKKISEKKRQELFHIIIKDSLYYKIEVIPVTEIDKFNINQAGNNALNRLVDNCFCDNYLIDYMKAKVNKNSQFIVKGDQKSISIAAASIVAKVFRDNLMKSYDYLYPNYNFSKHKGYYTKFHQEIIFNNEILNCYRKSYEPIKTLLKNRK